MSWDRNPSPNLRIRAIRFLGAQGDCASREVHGFHLHSLLYDAYVALACEEIALTSELPSALNHIWCEKRLGGYPSWTFSGLRA